MAGKGREALAALRAARGALGVLAGGGGEGSGPSAAGAEAGDEGADLLIRLGLEASLVVDTPEVVWSFLDEGRFTSAVGRLLQAEAAWEAMESGRYPAELLRLFPVIRRHWPKVQAMRGQVMQMVLQRLGSGAALSDADAAGLLVSLARLGGMSSPELVQLFLEKRLEGARERFGSVGGGGDLGELVAGLVHTGRLLQATVCQAFQLFAPRANGAAALLDLAPSFMEGYSSYLGPNAAAGQGGPGSHWGGAGMEGDLAALPTEETAQLCGEWLQELRGAFSDGGAFDGVGSAADLGRVEAEIKEALSLPYDELSVSGLHALVSAEPAAARACAALRDRDLGIWGMCFDVPLIGRGRVLIAEAFEGVVRAVQPLVEAGWASASGSACAARAPGGGGGLELARWSERFDMHPHVGAGGSGEGAGEGGVAGQEENHPSAAWRLQLREVRSALDQGLGAALQDALHVILRPEGAAALGARVRALEPAVAAKCDAAVREILEAARALLGGLPDGAPEGGGKSMSDAALFLGELAGALQPASSRALQAVLGPPREWVDLEQEHRVPAPLAAKAGALSTPASELLAGLTRDLREFALDSYRVWVAWNAGHLRSALEVALREAQKASAPGGGWHTVSAGGGLELSLPAAPSPGVLALLFAACEEVQRAGGHLLEPAALRELRAEILRAAATALEAFSDQFPGDSAPEALCLQLIFDLQFARGLLLHAEEGRPSPPSGGGEPETARALRAFSSRLDPIDWATYEPHLERLSASSLQKHNVLLGALLPPRHALRQMTAPEKFQASANASTIAFAPNPGRFGYLPIATPDKFSRRAQRQKSLHRGGGAPGGGAARTDPGGGAGGLEFGGAVGAGIGAVLGDRAAEMQAFAQDLATSNPFGSMFSSLTGQNAGRG